MLEQEVYHWKIDKEFLSYNLNIGCFFNAYIVCITQFP